MNNLATSCMALIIMTLFIGGSVVLLFMYTDWLAADGPREFMRQMRAAKPERAKGIAPRREDYEDYEAYEKARQQYDYESDPS